VSKLLNRVDAELKIAKELNPIIAMGMLAVRKMIIEEGNSLDGYQRDAMRTVNKDTGTLIRLGNFALGISGEAGEVADYIKKILYHGHPMDKDKLCKELGDVLWYVATLADTAGLTLEEVARGNIVKLRKRYPDGFSQERSINRDDSEVSL